MGTVATDPTTMRWLRLGAAGLAPRLALFALAAAGHFAFMWSMSGFSAGEIVSSIVIVTTNLMVLGWATLRRRHDPLNRDPRIGSDTVMMPFLRGVGAGGLRRRCPDIATQGC